MPIPLGILAQYRPAAGGGAAYEFITTATPSGSSSTVTFSNLDTYNTTYQHLQLRITGRSTRSETDSVFKLSFNGDSGSNYNAHYVQGTGSTVNSGDNSSSSTGGIYTPYFMAAATSATGVFGAGVIDILDAYETTKFKTVRMLAGQSASYTRIALYSGLWRSTNAITSISLVDQFGNWTSTSRISLYGIKGA